MLLVLVLVQSESIFIKLELFKPIITLLVLQVQQITLLSLVLDCGLAALLRQIDLHVLHLILPLDDKALFIPVSLQNSLLLLHLIGCLVHCAEFGLVLVVPLFCCLFEPLEETYCLLLRLVQGI